MSICGKVRLNSTSVLESFVDPAQLVVAACEMECSFSAICLLSSSVYLLNDSSTELFG